MFLLRREGGLGIRNFEIFNQALLEKQAWRILTKPNSLMSKVLRGKYFTKCSFLETKISPNMSFTSRSIFSARKVIVKGMCRVIGDGNDTHIWNDPWVPGLRKCRVESPCRAGEYAGIQKVHDLILENEWNINLLNTLFQPWERRAIQNIPVPIQRGPDDWMWVYTKNGQYSVRSAYYNELHAVKAGNPSTSFGHTPQVSQQLWKAKVPPKVKLFGWKMLHNGIPVYQNL